MSNIILGTIDDNILKTPDCGNHIATDWQFSDTSDFSNIVFESLDDTVNLLTFVYGGPLFINNAGDKEGIYIRSRFKTTNFTTDWNTGEYYFIDINNPSIEKPSLNHFEFSNGNVRRYYFTQTGTYGTVTTDTYIGKTTYKEVLAIDPFAATGNLQHTATRWKIYEAGSLNRPLEFTTSDPFLTEIDLIEDYQQYNFDTGIPYRLKYGVTYILEVTFISNTIESPTARFKITPCECGTFATSITGSSPASRSLNVFMDTSKLTCADTPTGGFTPTYTGTTDIDNTVAVCNSDDTSLFFTDQFEDSTTTTNTTVL